MCRAVWCMLCTTQTPLVSFQILVHAVNNHRHKLDLEGRIKVMSELQLYIVCLKACQYLCSVQSKSRIHCACLVEMPLRNYKLSRSSVTVTICTDTNSIMFFPPAMIKNIYRERRECVKLLILYVS